MASHRLTQRARTITVLSPSHPRTQANIHTSEPRANNTHEDFRPYKQNDICSALHRCKHRPPHIRIQINRGELTLNITVQSYVPRKHLVLPPARLRQGIARVVRLPNSPSNPRVLLTLWSKRCNRQPQARGADPQVRAQHEPAGVSGEGGGDWVCQGMWDSVLKLGVGLGVSAVKGWNGMGWDEADVGFSTAEFDDMGGWDTADW